MRMLICIIALVALVHGFTTPLNIKLCDQNGCRPAAKRIALDVDSNHTSTSGKELITVGGADNDELTLTYGDSVVGGPRVYLIEEDGVNKNTMFQLNGNEFTFDVELSTMKCGFNAALYFVGMAENSGSADQGVGYCDAQAVDQIFCSEMDILEANQFAQQYTTHACTDACASYSKDTACRAGSPSPCDQSGCGLNPFRYGPGTTWDVETNNEDWYGPGSSYTLDSTKKFTVVTQFNSGASGTLSSITRFYMQNDKRVDLPTLYVIPPTGGNEMGGMTNPSLTESYCADIYDRWNGGNTPLAGMGKNMENGMVLAMSAWYAQETYVNGKPQGTQTGMSWLDGMNFWGKFIKAGPCDTTTSDAGGPYFATFSDIRFGKIGTTVPNAPPTPTQKPTTPKPEGSCCFYNGCNSCQTGTWCSESEENCTQNCSGTWCPGAGREKKGRLLEH